MSVFDHTEKKMKAAWFESFGPASDVLRVGEQEKPEAGHGEVLIRLASSGVNPSDVKKRAGSFPNLLDEGFVIPHSDGAGVIEAVGEGVPANRTGERVWIYQAQHGRRLGSAAEYIALDQRRAAPLPGNTGFEIGACIGIPVMTAHRCVFADGPVDGQTVVITGGAGRVGHYAVQWAAQAGARVIATASNDDDAESCKRAGASVIVNHRDKDWAAQIVAANDGNLVDRVIDVEFGANLPAVLDMIRTSGTIVTYSSTVVTEPKLPFYRMMFLDLVIRMVIVYAMPETAKQAAIDDITDALAKDLLQHRVAHVLPLDEIAQAHELIEQAGFPWLCRCNNRLTLMPYRTSSLPARLLLVMIVFLIFSGCAKQKDEEPVAFANGEELHGAWANASQGLAVFKGIPFAAPPVGDLRWRAPVANQARSGPQTATGFAPACMQTTYSTDWYAGVARTFGSGAAAVGRPVGVSEDCLYLNIWTPELKPGGQFARDGLGAWW